MLTLLPFSPMVRKAFGRPMPLLEEEAVDRWTIAAASKQYVPPAKYLPDHIHRIKGAAFVSLKDVITALVGDFEITQAATVGYRLRDISLVDGMLYGSKAVKSLWGKQRRLPAFWHSAPSMRGAMFESWTGNRWFGNWLSDDCLTYQLAQAHGIARKTRTTEYSHEPQYKSKFNMRPEQVENAHFDELIVFDDDGHNAGKSERAAKAREALVGSVPAVTSHAGVFILRGMSGEKRCLANETELAENFASRYGFRVIEPNTSTVDEIIEACAGAKVVAGVEGSHLVHGTAAMAPKSTLFVIQPADRVVSALKILTDRQDQSYAFVVGEGTSQNFHVAWDDIDRTMALVHQ